MILNGPLWNKPGLGERETLARVLPAVSHLLTRGDSKMTRRDWELLDKQLWGVSSPPPQNGAKIGLTIIAVFLAGIGIGDILFAPQSQPILTHDAVSVASNAQSIMR